MVENDITNKLHKLARINMLIFGILIIFEFIAIFVDIPIFFTSEGDAAGIGEFAGGNWFDHLLKILVQAVLFSIFLNAVKGSASATDEEKARSKAFSIGGGLIVIALGSLYILIWFSQLLDSALTESLSEWVWYSSIRIEMVLTFINLPIFRIWKNKNAFM